MDIIGKTHTHTLTRTYTHTSIDIKSMYKQQYIKHVTSIRIIVVGDTYAVVSLGRIRIAHDIDHSWRAKIENSPPGFLSSVV